MNARKLARGLGWFSVGLGLTELFAGRSLARSLGLEHRTDLIRAFGARELATGVGILTQARKGPWVWARVAGDVLDLAVLASALSPRNPERGKAAFAFANVAAVSALDVVCGGQLRAAA
jgi:hypothetical protein